MKMIIRPCIILYSSCIYYSIHVTYKLLGLLQKMNKNLQQLNYILIVCN